MTTQIKDITPESAVMIDAFGNSLSVAYPDERVANFQMINCHLSRVARYAGATRAEFHLFSVGQHKALGALAILIESRDIEAAIAFFHHDDHESILQDLSLRTRNAIALRMPPQSGQDFLNAISQLKFEADRHIYAAAGLPWPLPEHLRVAVKTMDARILDYENAHFRIACDAEAETLRLPRHPGDPLSLPEFNPPIWPEFATRKILDYLQAVLTLTGHPPVSHLTAEIQKILDAESSSLAKAAE